MRSKEGKQEAARVAEILRRLEKQFPNAETELAHENPFQLLAATILSAQCTDARVNEVTPKLFRKYPAPGDLMKADRETLESIIRSTGFYKSKSNSLIGCSKELVERFGGVVPQTLDELVTLPGVGRKTANVILGSAFGKPAVIVDTHVRRVANRLKLTRSDDPDRIEEDLSRLIPVEKWTAGSHRILLHGRYICVARNPHCLECPLFDLCPAEKEKKAAQARAKSAGRLTKG
ncbi:MAG TPA: endonuclease III [Candidatus Manganitrophaceae bacterium]|nr:endonuclease III [Candidatus Manganitrophaceae bacterium]